MSWIAPARPSPSMVVSVAALLIAVGGAAFAAIPDSDDSEIHGCYVNRTGALRVIDTQAGQTCTSKETALVWNQEGPPGAPGADGADGADGAAVSARIQQTAAAQSGEGEPNATSLPLSGDMVPVGTDVFSQTFPAPLSVDPPANCDGPNPQLNLAWTVANFNFTIFTWTIPYTDGAPKTVRLDHFWFDIPVDNFTANIDIRVWDNCTGVGQRWGVGETPPTPGGFAAVTVRAI